MGIKRLVKAEGAYIAYQDPDTFEIVDGQAPYKFMEDFDGAAWNSTDGKIAAFANGTSMTPALRTDGDAGRLTCALSTVSEDQDTGIRFGANRSILLPTQGLLFQARVKINALPSAAEQLISIGLTSDATDTSGTVFAVDSCTTRAAFRINNAGVLTVVTDDTTTDSGNVDTGEVIAAGSTYYFTIDATDWTNVKFYLDTERLSIASTFTLTAAQAIEVQPLLCCSKKSGTDASPASIDIDKIVILGDRPS